MDERQPSFPISHKLEQGSLQSEVEALFSRRQTESQELQRRGKTLHEALIHFDNDYVLLDELYKEKVGAPLITDPFEAAGHTISITKFCTIVIPAYNPAQQLRHTLDAIQASSFNAKYPQQLEVIIVDDGSPNEDVAEQVRAMGLTDLNVRVLRQSNGRENKARYSGAVHAAEGSIVLFTAQDTVYSPTMIEEYMKRHEALDNIVSFGFRQEIDEADERLSPAQIVNGALWELPYNFEADPRVRIGNMRDCDWLKKGGNNKTLPIDVEDDRFYGWTVPAVAYGFSVSAPREALLRTFGGYDPRYTGFGGDDEHMVSDLIAEGFFVIPNTGGIAYHQSHFSRWDEKEAAINRKVWQENLGARLRRQDPAYPLQTDAVLKYQIKNGRTEPRETPLLETDLYTQAKTLLKMGLYEQAVEVFDSVGEEHANIWFFHDKAMALTKLGGKENVQKAITYLERLTEQMPDNVAVYVSLAVAYGRNGIYDECRSAYVKALHIDPDNEDAQLINPLDGDGITRADTLHEKGRLFLSRGKPGEAMIYYEAAIALVGKEVASWSLFDKGVALVQLGHLDEAKEVFEETERIMPQNTWVFSQLGNVYEKMGSIKEAMVYFKKAIEIFPDNQDAQKGLTRLGYS